MNATGRVTMAMGFLAAGVVSAGDAPEVFSPFLKQDVMIKGEVVVVLPPREINKYLAKVKEAAKADPAWFREYSETAKPGVPVPFHEKLGLTRDEYDEYLALWKKREMKAVQDGEVMIRLEEIEEGAWMIRVSGEGYPITNLKYLSKEDVIKSPNGTMTRLEDIESDPMSILGKWSGHEWRFKEEDSLGATKENFAIGKTGDGGHGLLVYRLQSVSLSGRILSDKSLVIRFPLAKG